MADAKKAIDFMLHQEDAKLAGVITNTKNDHGGTTRFGLCAKFHPALVEAGFFDAAKVPHDQALQMAEATYTTEYAKPLRIEALKSDMVACAMISFAVLDGLPSAMKMLRNALDTFGYCLSITAALEDDATFAAENEVAEDKLVAALVQHQRARAQQIVAHDPTQADFAKGWSRRADQVATLVKGSSNADAVAA